MSVSTFILSLSFVSALIQSVHGEVCKLSNGEDGILKNAVDCPSMPLRIGNIPQSDWRSTYYHHESSLICCPIASNEAERQSESTGEQIHLNNPKYYHIPTPNEPFPESLDPQGCGVSDVNHVRVVGGVTAQPGAWPWMAALAFYDSSYQHYDFKCGGALISRRHVLTAAHCVYGRFQYIFKVRIGVLDLTNHTEGAHPIDVGIANITIHPQFSPPSFANDIAVIEVTPEVRISEFVRPICLPTSNGIDFRDLTAQYAFVIGFGLLNWARTGGVYSNTLQEVQLPIVSEEVCKPSYQNKSVIHINQSVICAGYAAGGRDACKGDSGGPLMISKGQTFYIIGIVSIGIKCALPNRYGIYTRVTEYMDFISKSMESNP